MGPAYGFTCYRYIGKRTPLSIQEEGKRRDLYIPTNMKELIEQAIFVKIQERKLKLLLGSWVTDPKLKDWEIPRAILQDWPPRMVITDL